MNSTTYFRKKNFSMIIFQQNTILKLIWDSENHGCFLTLPTEGKIIFRHVHTAADTDFERCSYRSHRHAFRNWLNAIRLYLWKTTVMQSCSHCCLANQCLYGPKREKPHLKEQNDEAWRNERNQEGNARSPETQALDSNFTTHCAKQAQSKSKKDPPVQIMTVGRAYLPTKAVVS